MQLQRFTNKKYLAGFTLIEILVVISIMAIIITIAIVSYTTVNKQSRDSKRKSDVEQLRSALEMYRSDIGYYPSVGSESWTNASNLPLVPTYLSIIPSDPKSSQSYYYTVTPPASGGNYYTYCLCAQLELAPASTLTCAVAAPLTCNYVVKNP